MKSAFQLFKKKNAPSHEPAKAEDVSTQSPPPPIQLNLGSDSSGFLSSPRRSIALVTLLVVALSAFSYRYIIRARDVEAIAPPIVDSPKPIAPKVITGTEAKDQIAKARQLFEKNQIEDSIAIYQTALQKTPNDAQLLNDLGVLYLKKKKLSQSETHLKQSIELDPKCVVCLNNLGYLKTLQGENANAERYLKEAIEINDEYLDPYFNLGVLYEKNGDIARSASAYSEFLNRSKDKDSPFNLKLKQHLFSILEK